VVIAPDGTVRIEVRGVNGPACLAATADLEAALGGQVVSREMTSEALAVEAQVDEHVWRST
jgi:hypothetical protein